MLEVVETDHLAQVAEGLAAGSLLAQRYPVVELTVGAASPVAQQLVAAFVAEAELARLPGPVLLQESCQNQL